MKKVFLICGLLVLAGCYEAEIQLETTLLPDGSFIRKSVIREGGSNWFLEPQGARWESQITEGEDSQRIFPYVIRKVESQGKFKNAKEFVPDIRFNVQKLLASLSSDEQSQLEGFGIQRPFEENLFFKNKVDIGHDYKFFSEVFYYREELEESGLIKIALHDLGREIKARDPALTEAQIKNKVEEKLTADFLNRFHFEARVTLPGKVTYHNGMEKEGRSVIWRFNGDVFKEGKGNQILEARSKIFRGDLLFYLFFILTGILVIVWIWKKKGN